MITLSQAFKLCKIRDDELVYLRRSNVSFATLRGLDIYTGKYIREKMDMKKIWVVSIRPFFSFGEYEGMEFEVVLEK